MKILNLPAILQGKVDLTRDGRPVGQFKGVFAMNNGIVTAKELLLDSPVLKMSGFGQYDRKVAGRRARRIRYGVVEVKGSATNPQLRYLPAGITDERGEGHCAAGL